MTQVGFSDVALLLVDIDGTLTDAKIAWGGPSVGWTQTFSARDGEAIRRAGALGLPVVPLSRNGTLCAKTRIEGLGLRTDWLGVADKLAGFASICEAYPIAPEHICYVADGREDVPILEQVGLPCVVANGHHAARRVAKYVTRANGGDHAVEEVIELILEARGWGG